MSKATKTLIAISVFAGIAAIGYGMYNFVSQQIKGAMNFCYKIANVKFTAISNSLVSFILELKLLQNSDLRLKLKHYYLNIAINNKVVASIKGDKEIDILPKAVSYLSTVVSFNPSSIFDIGYITELLYNATLNQKEFIIEISGSVLVKANFISLTLPIKAKMSLEDIMKPSPVDPNKDKQMSCKIY